MFRRYALVCFFVTVCIFACKRETSSAKQFPSEWQQNSGSPNLAPIPSPAPALTIDVLWKMIGKYIDEKKKEAAALDPKFAKQTFVCFDHSFLLYSQEFINFAAKEKINLSPLFVLAFDASSEMTFGHTGVVFKTTEALYGEKYWYSEYNKRVPYGPYLEGNVTTFWGLSDYVFESAGFFAGYNVSLNAKKVLKSIVTPLDYTAQAYPLRRTGTREDSNLRFKKASRY